LRRLAIAGVLGAFAGNALFTLSQWQNYDLRPVTDLLAVVDAAHGGIADQDFAYAGQFHFAARLQHPVEDIQDNELAGWAAQHPHGVVVEHPARLKAADMRYAMLVQPFRSGWVVVWKAPVLAALRAGRTPEEPAQPTLLYPEGYWRYRAGR
jgi:hypothetical protein